MKRNLIVYSILLVLIIILVIVGIWIFCNTQKIDYNEESIVPFYCDIIDRQLNQIKEQENVNQHIITITLNSRKNNTANIAILVTGDTYYARESCPIKYENGKWISNGLNVITN